MSQGSTLSGEIVEELFWEHARKVVQGRRSAVRAHARGVCFTETGTPWERVVHSPASVVYAQACSWWNLTRSGPGARHRGFGEKAKKKRTEQVKQVVCLSGRAERRPRPWAMRGGSLA